jgi:hypothetical protein
MLGTLSLSNGLRRARIALRSMARWARLELATDGLEIRCSILLSYHRIYQITQLTSAGLALKGKADLRPRCQVSSDKDQEFPVMYHFAKL